MPSSFHRLLLSLLLLLVVPWSVPGQPAEEPIEKPPGTRNVSRAEAAPTSNPAMAPSPPKRPRARSTRVALGDRVAVGDDVVVKADETVGFVWVVGGSATIDGRVSQDLVVLMGSARLGPKAEVKHDLTVIGGALDADPRARIGGSRRVVAADGPEFKKMFWARWPAQWVSKGLMYGRPLPHQFGWSWALAGVALLLYLVLALLFPRPIQAAVMALEQRPGNALATGLLTFLLAGPLLILLTVTVVGLVVVPFALTGLVVALVFGKVAVYRYAGHQVGVQFGSGLLQQPLLALLVGGLLFCLLYTIPALGFLVWATVASLGLGAVLLALFGRSPAPASRGLPRAGREGFAATGPAESAAPRRGPAASPGVAGAAEPAALLPRAGFWLRLTASLLDLLLVGTIMVGVLHRLHWFLLAWVVYHLVFWTWWGTTLGGLVLGLNVVRLDGRPMNFAVALVRLLGSFFSIALLGLGFFWAGWSADKQSWHDSLAGTVIIKASRTARGVAGNVPCA